MLVHKHLPAAVERLVLVQGAQPDHLGADRIRLQDGLLDLLIDVAELALDEELEPPRRRHPRLDAQVQQPVLVRHKRLADQPQDRHEGNAQRQEGLQPPRGLEGARGERAKREGQVEQAQQLRAVRHEHDVRRLVGRRLAPHGLLVQLVAGGVDGAVHVVVQRHEQAEVRVHLGVVQGVVRGRVDHVLHARQVHEPRGDELEVAVPDGVEEVEPDEVGVEHHDGRAAEHPRAQQRDGEVGGVHEVLHEGVHAAGDGLGDERRVVVRVVRAVQRVVVQRAVQPVVHKLRRARVQQQHLHYPRPMPEGESAVPQARGLVHQGHHYRLEDDEVVPVVFPVHLLEVYPLGLDLRVLRDGVDAAQGYPELRVHVADGDDHNHVERPAVGVVQPEGHRGGEGREEQVLEAAHVLPRELVPRSRLQRHGGGGWCSWALPVRGLNARRRRRATTCGGDDCCPSPSLGEVADAMPLQAQSSSDIQCQ
mmetsp:Transcript_39454/g.97690  ORF Transcript_39454/g.97690 Transcript_39454/m.97690 type:complete len:478 (-) Transcript_39454:440-1873(-)